VRVCLFRHSRAPGKASTQQGPHTLGRMRRIGNTDLEVFPLCFGGNVFGWTADASSSLDILDSFVHAGGNFIDTADAYSRWVPGHVGGESETIMGEWLSSRGNRDDLIIATKVGKKPNLLGLAPETIRQACDESLMRMRIDVIDLYYCHADDPEVPLVDTLGALNELVEAGKVRYIAASNYSVERLSEALAISDAHGWPRFIALQPHYNLMVRHEYEGPMQDLCAREQISCLPYYSLASGFLTGKYRDPQLVHGDRAAKALTYFNDRGLRVLTALDEVAARHDTTPTAAAIAWLNHQRTVTAAIASVSRIEQLPDLMTGAVLPLTPLDIAELNAASDPQAKGD
jgi:aryl-alcohol dehydrogenase-like predicted oxidoreductase